MDTVSRSILGYQVSKSRDVDPCILTMRMAFDKFKRFLHKALNFIADGYSACPLAVQQFNIEKDYNIDVTQVIGFTNDDGVNLRVAYYNFLRPHEVYHWKRPLNEVEMLKDAGNL